MVLTEAAPTVAASPVPPPPSSGARLSGHLFTADISDTKYNYRVLKLNGSLFVYIGPADNEHFTEMAVAMPVSTGDCLTTTIMGEQLGCSHELAANFAKKLSKQVFVSCNVPEERQIRPVLAKRFAEEVRSFPEHF